MGKGKKKFIDKKKAATFALLYRESTDGEEVGPDRVFTRVDCNETVEVPGLADDASPGEDSKFDDAEGDEMGSDEELEPSLLARQTNVQQGHGLPEHVKRELLEMGFPDDGYNYMKHMRSIGAGGGTLFVPTTNQRDILLPVDVKAYDASRVQVGVVPADEDLASPSVNNTTHIRQIRGPSVKAEGLDPEVAAALEDSDLSETESVFDLEDDFVLVANKGVEGESSISSEPMFLDKAVKPDETTKGIEERSRRIEERASGILDEQFELLALREYDDDSIELGDDDPRARGHADISEFSSVLAEFLADDTVFTNKYEPDHVPMKSEKMEAHLASSDKMPLKTRGFVPVKESTDVGGSSESEEEMEEVFVDDEDEDAKEKWDCETVVSTFSNLDNHPARIGTPGNYRGVKFASITESEETKGQTIRIGGRQKLPLDFVSRKPIAPEEVGFEPNEPSLKHKIAGPRGGETPAERKARKAAIKDEKRASRQAKKELKIQYKSESQKAQVGAAVMGPRAIHLP